jgi:hypothetical protein
MPDGTCWSNEDDGSIMGAEGAMKGLSTLVGLAGIAVLAAAVYGRFHGVDTINVSGHSFAAGNVLSAGNALLLLAIWLGLRAR